jgi:cobalt/nickel transport system permease protein
MHIPDGFINATTSLGAGAAAIGGLSVAIRRSAATLEDRQVPLAGLVAAFVFAAQMLNFPVAAGTSGHLIGGVLAAVLVGPWAGVLCLTVVLLVQALFADGGLTALGLNVFNLAFAAGLGGYGLFLGLRKLLPASRSGVVLSAGVASGLSVVVAAITFLVEYSLGANVGVPIGTVAGAMVGVHLLIGVGEAIITAMTVSAVLNMRPDLVHGARDLAAPISPAPVGVTAAAKG